MMRVRWTTNAADDLTRIVERIRKDNPDAAQRVARTIYATVADLRHFPHRGRTGLAENTRELVFPPVALRCRLRSRWRPGAGSSYPARRTRLALKP